MPSTTRITRSGRLVLSHGLATAAGRALRARVIADWPVMTGRELRGSGSARGARGTNQLTNPCNGPNNPPNVDNVIPMRLSLNFRV
jgi:hypothetical protein